MTSEGHDGEDSISSSFLDGDTTLKIGTVAESINEEVSPSTTTTSEQVQGRQSQTWKSSSMPFLDDSSIGMGGMPRPGSSPGLHNESTPSNPVGNNIILSSSYHGTSFSNLNHNRFSRCQSADASVTTTDEGTPSSSQSSFDTNSKQNHVSQQSPSSQQSLTADTTSRFITRILSRLMTQPTNRSCADCKSTLIDPSQVYVSVSPIFKRNRLLSQQSPRHRGKKRNINHDNTRTFTEIHQTIAPPLPAANDADPSCSSMSTEYPNGHILAARDDPPIDPALVASSYICGHGVFLCAMCGAVHKILGQEVTIVHSAQDTNALWTQDMIDILMKTGGNARASLVLERYLSKWQNERMRPKGKSSIADRLMFARAKYQALVFALPPTTGPLASSAWEQIVQINHPRVWGNEGWAKSLVLSAMNDLSGFASGRSLQTSLLSMTSIAGDLASMRSIRSNMTSAQFQSFSNSANAVKGSSRQRSAELPNRLVDHFCVITASQFLEFRFIHEHHGKRMAIQPKLPEDVHLRPIISDCYPPPDTHEGEDFPEHVATFVFPEGCTPSSVQLPPSFYSFVLTDSSGDRLYGAVLRIYDDVHDYCWLRKAFLNHRDEWGDILPSWLLPESSHDQLPEHADMASTNEQSRERTPLLRSSGSAMHQSDIIFVPKCLVVLSHYPFFDLWRKFLLQLYRITLTEAPLPIERFIANFVREVPLPPPGKVQVRFGFTVHDTWPIERPPDNQLPMASFSFQPLFASLSVSNILVVMGCILHETRVALLSKHYSMLVPTAEALLSLLFPFHWQGMYLPVMPYHMLDILDAPVPFLVGLHSRYLEDVPRDRRPTGVVFVDLDKDIVHLGYEDDKKRCPRRPVCFPERQITKLRSKLMTFGAVAYIPPAFNTVGSITNGDDKKYVAIGDRHDSYVFVSGDSMNSSLYPYHGLRRKDVFPNTDKAFKDNELINSITGFLSEQGQFTEQHVGKWRSESERSSSKFFLLSRRGKNSSKLLVSLSESHSTENNRSINLLDLNEPDGFSSIEIRLSFLRFFVSIFQTYKSYIVNGSFQSSDFLSFGINHISQNGTPFVEGMLQTQMFHAFIEERLCFPNDAEVMFFDESIVEKQNRSAKNAISNIGLGRTLKRHTTFLSDTTNRVTNIFTPPPPSNWGLPDDGRTYCYGSFPKLESELFGKIREPMKWSNESRQDRASIRIPRRSSITSVQEQAILRKTLMLPATTTHALVKTVVKVGAKNLENAINVLSTPFVPRTAKVGEEESRSRHRRRGSDSSCVSDVTLPSTLDFSPEFVSTAEEIILNARRKQAVLIGIMIKLQSVWRRQLVKHHWKELVVEKKRLRELVSSPSFYHKRKMTTAAVRIQSFVRSACQRMIYLHCRKTILRLESRWRAKRICLAYGLLIGIIRRFQAVVRGRIVRRLCSSIVQERLQMYRSQIFKLWHQTHTPLSFRSRFWPILQVPRFLRLSLAESELSRLWSILNLTFSTDQSNSNDIEQEHLLLNPNTKLGICNTCYRHAVKVDEMLRTGVGNGKSIFAKKKHRLGGDATSSDRVLAERLQIYDKLCNGYISDKILDAWYATFSISQKSKNRKVSLAETVWCNYDEANESANFILVLFPELECSTNISFAAPSKKGIRRFPAANPSPTLLARSMWVDNLLDQRIRQNVSTVADACIRKVPFMMTRLSEKQKQARDWPETFSRKLKAIQSVYGLKRNEDAGYFIMKQYY